MSLRCVSEMRLVTLFLTRFSLVCMKENKKWPENITIGVAIVSFVYLNGKQLLQKKN